MRGRLRTALILFAEIAVLLAAFLLFLLVLGYFKVIALPNFSPKAAIPTTAPINTKAVNSNQNSTPVSFTKLQHQASPVQIKSYMGFAAGFNEPTKNASPSSYASNGVFSGYDSRTIQVVTKDGVLNLSFDANTLFQKYATRKSNADGLVKPTSYTSADFFKNVSFGSVVIVLYSKPDLKATQVGYIESIKPIP